MALLLPFGISIYLIKEQLYYEQGIVATKQLGSLREQIPILNNLGVVTYILGLFDESKAYYNRSLQITREVNEKRSELLALNNLGRLHFTLGQYEQANIYLRKGYELGRQINESWGAGVTLNNLGFLYDLQTDYEKAKPYYEQALDLHQHANHRPGKIKATVGLLHIGIHQDEDISHLLTQMFTFLAEDKELKGSEHVMEIYLQFYRCLILLDHGAQTAVLAQAYDLLQERASRLQKEVQRNSFLYNVPEHHKIIELYEQERLQS